MPIYEYRCHECGERFESFRAISDRDDSVECPKCGKKDSRRVISPIISRNSSGKSGVLNFPT
jgi:putative FmdB family regulatory protein